MNFSSFLTKLISGKNILQSWSEKINRAHSEAKKDNDFIYHDQEPRPDALQAIGRAALAKSIALGPTPVTSNFKDIFEKLVPTAVHQALQAFESRQAEITNIEVSRSRAATQELKRYSLLWFIDQLVSNVTSASWTI